MYPGFFAERTPDRPACVYPDHDVVLSFAELEQKSNQAAHLFREYGLQIGDCLSILMENNPLFLVLCWGAQRAGLYFNLIPSHSSPRDVEYIVRDSGAKLLIVSEEKAEVAAQVVGNLPADIIRLVTGPGLEGFRSLEEALEAMPRSRIGDETEGQDFIYSSGSTGQPKGIKLPLRGVELGGDNPYHEKLLIMAGFPREGDSLFSPAPQYHSAPQRICFTMHRAGATCIIPRRFDPVQSLQAIENYRVTHSLWVPTMFVRMLKLEEELRRRFDVSAQRIAIHGAAPCSIEVKKQMIDWFGPILLEYYGATEANGFCCIDSHEWRNKPGSVGKPILGEIHVLDDVETEVPVGEPGKIYFDKGFKFSYHNDPDKTASATSKQGWTTTGDMGYVDNEGYLYLTDRSAFMIISGGVNIYPQEIEDFIIQHPSVMDVAVIGVPHQELGEQVKAFVQLKNTCPKTEELEAELLRLCRDELGPVKSPKSVDFRESLPREENGKLYKQKLRNEFWLKQ